MNNVVNKKNLKYWDKLYEKYRNDDVVSDNWLWVFNQIINDSYGPVIDLGCGSGNDIMYLLGKGKKVIACDGSKNAILNVKNNYPQIKDVVCFDMLDGFPFSNNMTDLIIADLSLHYFKREDTINILKEIKRLLVNNGHMLLRVNSINDINYGAGVGKEVEHHLYMTKDGRYKRFFDYNDLFEFFNLFDIKYIREETTKRYRLEKKAFVVDVKNRG